MKCEASTSADGKLVAPPDGQRETVSSVVDPSRPLARTRAGRSVGHTLQVPHLRLRCRQMSRQTRVVRACPSVGRPSLSKGERWRTRAGMLSSRFASRFGLVLWPLFACASARPATIIAGVRHLPLLTALSRSEKEQHIFCRVDGSVTCSLPGTIAQPRLHLIRDQAHTYCCPILLPLGSKHSTVTLRQ